MTKKHRHQTPEQKRGLVKARKILFTQIIPVGKRHVARGERA